MQEWQAYEQLEPFGERGAWHRAGLIVAMLVNVQPKKKGARNTMIEADRFMPRFDEVIGARRGLDPAQVREVFDGFRQAQRAQPAPARKGAK